MAWYYDERRLLLEYEAIEKAFPQFEFDTENNEVILKGALHSNRENYYAIKLVYPNNFPHSHPEPFFEGMEIDGKWYDTLPWFGRRRSHMYSSKHICWNDRNRAGVWDPSKSTAVVVLAAVSLWIFSYEAYVLDGDDWLASDHN